MGGIDWHDIGNTSLSTTAITAALSSTITKTMLYPLDTIKCRMQSFANTNRVSDIWKFRGIFNGLIPKIALYAPYQSVYMTSYTWCRDGLSNGTDKPELWNFAVAGTVAELGGSIVRVPMEAIKQRMQTGLIKSNRELVNIIIKNPIQFYTLKNFKAQTLVHDIPCGVVHWVAYEYTKRGNNSAVMSGAIAGTITAIVTNPMDVVKTRIITRGTEMCHRTVFSTISTVFAQNGFFGFYTGIIPRILHIAPNSALYMWVFDSLFKSIEKFRTY